MRKWSHFLLLCLILYTSCIKSSHVESDSEEQIQNDEALALSATSDMWNTLFAVTTKSNAPSIKSIRKAKNIKTKSESENSSVFVINYCNDQGFSVVRTNQNSASVVAISDNGNIEADYLGDSPCLDSEHKELYNYIEYSLERISDAPDTTHSSYICEHIIFDPDSVHVSTGEWMLNYNIAPLVQIKWGQSYPFNQRMPVLATNHESCFSYTSYRGRYPVGCVPIAIAQVMITTGHPEYFVGNVGTYNLSDFVTISRYDNVSSFQPYNYDAYADSLTLMKMDKITDMLRKIANGVNVTYTCSGTGAYTWKAISYLYQQDPSYYDDGEIRTLSTGSADNPIVLSLLTNEPLIIASPGHHAWVLDGLFHIHKHNLDGSITTKKLYHFNWGWRGYADGYYAYNDFTFANREAQAGIDTNTNLYNSTTNYYQNDAYVIFFTVYHDN